MTVQDSHEGNPELIMDMLGAIEARKVDRLASFYGEDMVFEWQPGLPYAGTHRGTEIVAMSETFARVWAPLQPDARTRALNPRIVACSEGGEVVAQYDWSGVSAGGESFSTPTLAQYRVRGGKLRYARMFHFDLEGLLGFLWRHGTGGTPAAS